MFSVNSEEEAQKVIVATCSMGKDRKYYSHDLAREQTLDNLTFLGDKMARVYERILENGKR